MTSWKGKFRNLIKNRKMEYFRENGKVAEDMAKVRFDYYQ
jgi:hypothetical protein